MKRILVTGCAGFIGSNFIKYMMTIEPDCEIVGLDSLTYAGTLSNLTVPLMSEKCKFILGDIRNREDVIKAMTGVDTVVNFAAETHVDRSLSNPNIFMETNVMGLHNLLEVVKDCPDVTRFVQVSTDEVYGDIPKGSSVETDILRPSSPYSASKAAGELLALSYHRTFDVPVVITRGSNTYGPNQYPEKLIPLLTAKAIDNEPLPVYGDGLQVRDWMHVKDHCAGIAVAMMRGDNGEIYNVGGGRTHTNMEIVKQILKTTQRDESLITHVTDRLGHDLRYSLDSTKLQRLGWCQNKMFCYALPETIQWYIDHQEWWRKVIGS